MKSIFKFLVLILFSSGVNAETVLDKAIQLNNGDTIHIFIDRDSSKCYYFKVRGDLYVTASTCGTLQGESGWLGDACGERLSVYGDPNELLQTILRNCYK